MTDTQKIPQIVVDGIVVSATAYIGVAYGVSVVTRDSQQADVLIIGPTTEAVSAAIHSAWPGQPVYPEKMSRVVVMGEKDLPDNEL